MAEPPLTHLCDLATEAHTLFQQHIEDIDPMVGVSQNMRTAGVPADAMTIDCPQNRKRILLILHDQQPDTLRYQFGSMDSDPERKFHSMPLDQLTAWTLYDWMKQYFQAM